MARRSGVTLIEVLVSIFVTAIGLLAILALFPVGAFSMANAIKNGRCVQASINATAFARFANVANDPLVTSLYINADSVLAANGQYPTIVQNTQQIMVPGKPPISLPYNGPSFPVYVDPIGTTIPGGQNWLGDVSFSSAFIYTSHVPRTPLSNGLPPARFMTLLDDIGFGPDGAPAYPSPSLRQVERENRYTWAYLLQRPSATYAGLVSASIVVYSGRSPFVLGENTFNFSVAGVFQGVEWNVTRVNQVDLTWNPLLGQSKPIIKNGTWVLDATCVYWHQGKNVVALPPEGPHAFFYRVVGVTEVPGANTLTLELQTNIRASSIDPDPITKIGSNAGATRPQPYGVLVVMDNVVEVFEKRPL